MNAPVSGVHMVARYKELIPDPDVIEISGCGHYPQMEAPLSVVIKKLKVRRRCP